MQNVTLCHTINCVYYTYTVIFFSLCHKFTTCLCFSCTYQVLLGQQCQLVSRRPVLGLRLEKGLPLGVGSPWRASHPDELWLQCGFWSCALPAPASAGHLPVDLTLTLFNILLVIKQQTKMYLFEPKVITVQLFSHS